MVKLVSWDPFRDLEAVSDRLNQYFGHNLPGRVSNEKREAFVTSNWTPSVDIVETPDAFQIKAEIPDVKKEDVKVSINAGILLIEGERKQEKEEKGKKFHRVERFFGSFVRTFAIPGNVDESKISADFKDGLLNINLPKVEKEKAKSIDVKIS